METIFISHSSKQKDLVGKVVDYLGRDRVIVDMYTFESGTKILDQIQDSLSETRIFVAFLSEEALASDWVLGELDKAYTLMGEGTITTFCPFLVDDKVDIEHEIIKKKKWLRESLLTHYRSPRLIAQVILRRYQEAVWKSDMRQELRDNLFIGRGADMDRLVNHIQNSSDITKKRAIIVSGLERVGRKTLLREVIRHPILKNMQPAFTPIVIPLKDDDSLDALIVQLNDVLLEFEQDEMLDMLTDRTQWLSIVVHQLNAIVSNKERIIIDDHRCIVHNDGTLAEWFKDVLRHSNLTPQIHFFISASRKPLMSTEHHFSEVIVESLDVLSRESMRAIFNTFAESYELQIPASDADFFAKRFTGFPEQATISVDNIRHNNMLMARSYADAVKAMFDNNFNSIIKEIANESLEYVDILALMAKIETFSPQLLQELCPVDISAAMELFDRYSLYECFGSARQFFHLTPGLQEYIERNRISISDKFKKHLEKHTRTMLESVDNSLTDLSTHLYAVKENIKAYRSKTKATYLLPSFVLKAVVEEYKAENNDAVIELTRKILYESQGKTYADVERSMHYWLCCALCRKGDNSFFNEVRFFDDAPYSQDFLTGFYYRRKKNYQKALPFFERALSESQDAGDNDYRSKAEHELVIVRMELEDYGGALELAKKSYEKQPTNTYHIDAYFRCLVREPHADKSILLQLITQMQSSMVQNRAEMSESMNAEYEFYVNHDFSKAVAILKQIINTSVTKPKYAFASLRRICQIQNANTVYESIEKKFRNRE